MSHHDEIPAAELNALAVYPHGNGHAVVLVGSDGEKHAFTVSHAKLKQVFYLIGNELQGMPSGTANVMSELGYE
jgi:hypothetical protein